MLCHHATATPCAPSPFPPWPWALHRHSSGLVETHGRLVGWRWVDDDDPGQRCDDSDAIELLVRTRPAHCECCEIEHDSEAWRPKGCAPPLPWIEGPPPGDLVAGRRDTTYATR